MTKFLAAGLVLAASLLSAKEAAEVDGSWIYTTSYPRHDTTRKEFRDEIGAGTETTTRYAGINGSPDLIVVERAYTGKPWTSLLVRIVNTTGHDIRVSRIRMMESVPDALDKTRVLSGSYSEDTPIVKIRDFADSPNGVHLAVGSQLLYNRDSGRSVFGGALTSHRWLTVFHLSRGSYTIDDEGTTELTATKSLSKDRPQDHIMLRVAVKPSEILDSEPMFFWRGRDYLGALREYGNAVRVLNHARTTAKAPWGWWSFTAFYDGISEGLANTNAAWLAEHMRSAGYNYLHIDEGYAYARGEYTTGDPLRFPNGLEDFARGVTRRGLTLGLWTAPFEVSERSWVYENHKDWLVKNENGEPIWLGKMKGIDNIYALDPTNPDAQAYLKQTYWTMAHVWGAGYIKMDFMEMSAVEGIYHRPNTSAIEAQRIGLEIIREAVGGGVILDKDGSPMLSPVGIVDAGRISNDTEHSYQGTFDAASGIAARFFMNRNFFIADPDVFCVSNRRSPDPAWDELKPVSLEEAKSAIVLSAVAGGMFEDGDDLPGLGLEPDRLALLTNPDLLKIMRLSRSANPLDLMSYAPEDLQPSIFQFAGSTRQRWIAVFNWSETERTHDLALDGNDWKAHEAFSADGVDLEGATLHVKQPSHSVRLVRLVKEDIPPRAPEIAIAAPETIRVAQPLTLRAIAKSEDNPILQLTWDFGDGTTSTGDNPIHTFTHAGSYRVRVTAQTVDGPPAVAEKNIQVEGILNTRFSPSAARAVRN